MRRLRQGSPGARGEAPPTRRAPRAAPCTFRSPRRRTRRGRRRWRSSSRAPGSRRACCSPRAPMTATGSYWVRTRPGPRRTRSAGSSGAPSGSTSPARRDAPPAAALAARRLGAVARRGAGGVAAGAGQGPRGRGGGVGRGRRACRRSDRSPPRGARGPVLPGPEAARGGGPLPSRRRHRGRLRVRRVAHQGGPRDRPRFLHRRRDRDVARRGTVRESTLAAAPRRLPRGGSAAVAVPVGRRTGATLCRSRRAARAVTRRLRAGVVDRPGRQRGDGARHPVAGRGARALDAGGDASAGRAAVARLGGPCGAGAAAPGAPRGRGGHARGRRRRRLGTVRARRRTACRDARPACRAAGPARSPRPPRPPHPGHAGPTSRFAAVDRTARGVRPARQGAGRRRPARGRGYPPLRDTGRAERPPGGGHRLVPRPRRRVSHARLGPRSAGAVMEARARRPRPGRRAARPVRAAAGRRGAPGQPPGQGDPGHRLGFRPPHRGRVREPGAGGAHRGAAETGRHSGHPRHPHGDHTMRFTRLELSGFKSFAGGVELPFDAGVTAIVGPNGCGKSNISDAVRWVLGEQSPRLLRGGKMEDVIFQGSTGRRPVNVAEVSLVFDNADGTLPLAYQEVVVTRRLSRSGQSEYLLNRSPVRLRDVQDLLRGTGLGADAAVVMEARMIEALLSEKAEERRALFEEAAGIGLYRDRKTSTERRLEETAADLARLEDLVSEVQTQVRSLARQRGKAERYGKMIEERFGIALTLVRRELEDFDLTLGGLGQRAEQLAAALPGERTRLDQAEQEREAGVQARHTAEARRTEVERRLADAKLESGRLEGDLALAAERLRNAGQRRATAAQRREQEEARALQAERERTAAAAECERAEQATALARAAAQAAAGLEQARRRVAELKEQETHGRAARRQAEGALAQVTARHDALAELERERVGLAPAAQALLKAREQFGDAV